MTSFEPPTGMEDLSSQADSVISEREQLARERAELEQERALVRRRRTIEDQTVIGGPVVEPTGEPSPSSPAVIDPTGVEYELGEDGYPQRDGSGQPIPRGEYDRDDNGLVLLDDEGKPRPVWPHQTVELGGRTIQVRVPAAAALQAFSMGVSKYTPEKKQNEMVALFVRRHISDRSYNDLLEYMMDPDDPFTIESFGDLMKEIATLGSGRPTPPS